MEWLIGIICIVIVIYFWRIFLPLAVLAGIALGCLLVYGQYQNEQLEKANARAAKELRAKITNAQRNATSEGKEWRIYGKRDPASNKIIARIASITSNDGLCHLTVQKRINGSELTGLDCPDIKISEYKDIYVKFDTDEISHKMDLQSYRDSDAVYIPSYQSEYSGYMSYREFIKGLVTAKAVAIKIPATDEFWVRFSLKSSTEAINQLGKELKSDNQPN